jgi:hypothetical protein
MPGPDLQTSGEAASARERVVERGAVNGAHAAPPGAAAAHARRAMHAPADKFAPDPPGRRRLAIGVGVAAVILVLALLAITASTV